MVAAAPLTGVMLLTIAVGVSAGLLAWRERPEPGALPLVAMLAGESLWAIMFVFEVQASTFGAKVFWSNLQWVGVVVIPVAWLLFSLEYTGRDHFVTLPTVAGLMVIPGVTVFLALTSDVHHLLYLQTDLVRVNGVAMLHRVGGPWYWVITGFTYIVGTAGAIPLLLLVRRDAHPFRGQSAAILIGILAPGAINALFLLGLIPIPGFDPTPIGFAISGVAYLGAVRRLRLFRTSPAPTQGAQRLVFERMQEGALVVDSHDFVVDMNDNVAEMLGVDPDETLGVPASEVIPQYETFPVDGQLDDHYTIDSEGEKGFFDVNVTQIHDFHNRPVGRVITFHDVGQHLRQRQRLEVLNRVLRHNIRNEANIIYGYVDRLDSEAAAEIKAVLERIEGLSDQARRISKLFEREEGAETASLDRLLTNSVESVSEDYPAVTIEYRAAPATLEVSSVLQPVFTNLLENGAEHNTSADPRVVIEVEAGDERVDIAFRDNGPGIDEYERDVLERGRETPLEHGSGLGLWLVTWGVHIAGGDVSFSEHQPTGSVITVSVPIRSRVEKESLQPTPP